LASSANAILLGLAPCDLRMLEPMDYVRLPARYALYAAGDALRCLYFPASAVASFVQADERGAMLETAHVGAEGVIGVTALLGAERARQRAVVRIAGGAYRVPLSAARSAFARSATFQAAILRFAEALILQLSQNVICKLTHTVEQQFCRRLLLYADRVPGAELEMTHEQMAEALGLRRQGITEAARRLQARQAIAYSRGRISVLDHAAVARHACECYGVVRSAYA
jgi:CRP-like cAMP-binding protein